MTMDTAVCNQWAVPFPVVNDAIVALAPPAPTDIG